jgi:Transglycosylase-like domain
VAARALLLVALLILPACGGAAAPPAPTPADVRRHAIEQRKADLMRQLADCESGGRSEATLGRGQHVGPFQFEPRTVINFVRQRDGRTLSLEAATALAIDYVQASLLAQYVIFERDGHGHWPACSRKIGLARQVAEIKAL